MATTQEAVQISAIVPTLTVDDLQKSITLLRGARLRDRRAVGRQRDAARRDAARGQEPDRLEPGRLEEGARPQEGNRRALVHLDAPGSVDEIAKRAKNAGITLKSEPHDTEWKSRAFEVSDPSGFLLTVFSDDIGVGPTATCSRVSEPVFAGAPCPSAHTDLRVRGILRRSDTPEIRENE